MRGEKTVNENILCIKKNGELFKADISGTSFEQDGKHYAVGFFRDVTERKAMEEALVASEEKFRLLAEHIPGVIYLCKNDERYRMLYLNDAVEQLTGYAKEDFLSDKISFVELYHPDDADSVMQAVDHSLAEQKPFDVQYRIRHQDGSWRWVHERGTGIFRDSELLFLEGFLLDVTLGKHIEGELQLSEANYHSMFDSANDAIFIHEIDTGKILRVNKRMCEMFHVDAEEACKLSVGDVSANIYPYTEEKAAEWIRKAVEEGPQLVEWMCKDSTGRLFWTEVSLKTVVLSGTERVIAIVRDISVRKQAENELHESEERFRALTENVSDVTCILDAEGLYKYANSALQRILDYAPDEILGKHPSEFIHAEDIKMVDRAIAQAAKKQGKTVPMSDFRMRHKNGSWVIFEGLVTCLVAVPGVNGVVIHCHDVTERKRTEDHIAHTAYHDLLTDLPNRRLCISHIEKLIAYAEKNDAYTFAVLFLDLDKFKDINDSLGHLVGDQFLVQVSNKLKTCIRSDAMLSRFAGDEFVLVLDDVSNVDDAIVVAERIRDTLSEPIRIKDLDVLVTTSIGIVMYTPQYAAPDDLLRDADTAMYHAKESGKARYEVFEQQMHINAVQSFQLSIDLRKAVEQEEFHLMYQPIISTKTKKIVAASGSPR